MGRPVGVVFCDKLHYRIPPPSLSRSDYDFASMKRVPGILDFQKLVIGGIVSAGGLPGNAHTKDSLVERRKRSTMACR